jgi:hypothetical protein
MSAPTGTLLVFATNPDNVASDGKDRNGTYTKHLLQYITQPGLEVGMLLRRVRTAVREETGGQQVPWENGSIEGEFYFNAMSGGPSVTPLGSSPPTPSPSTGTQVAVGVYPQQPQAPPATIVGNDGAEMVLVPAGEFIMGSDKDEIDRLLQGQTDVHRELFDREIPLHRVSVDTFYIDKYEVTNARFQQFVQATGRRTSAEREGSGYVYTGQKWEQVNGANWRATGARQQHCGSGAAPGGAGEPGGRQSVLRLGWETLADRGGVGESSTGDRWAELPMGKSIRR